MDRRWDLESGSDFGLLGRCCSRELLPLEGLDRVTGPTNGSDNLLLQNKRMDTSIIILHIPVPIHPTPQPTLQFHGSSIIQRQRVANIKEPLVRRKRLKRHRNRHGLRDSDLEFLAVLVLSQRPDLFTESLIESLLENRQIEHFETDVVRDATAGSVDGQPVVGQTSSELTPGDGVDATGSNVVDVWMGLGAGCGCCGEEDYFCDDVYWDQICLLRL